MMSELNLIPLPYACTVRYSSKLLPRPLSLGAPSQMFLSTCDALHLLPQLGISHDPSNPSSSAIALETFLDWGVLPLFLTASGAFLHHSVYHALHVIQQWTISSLSSGIGFTWMSMLSSQHRA